MCRTVADAAALLDALVGREVAGPLRPEALDGVRLAVPPLPDDLHADDRELFDAALKVMRDLGASTVEVPALPETDETPVLHYEFARDVDAYLARLPPGAPVRTMAELAAWNDAHADEALKYGQAHVLAALEVDHDADLAAYRANRARDLAVAGEHGIDATLLAAGAAAVVTPGWHGAGQAARAGYPSITVPGGYRRSGRQPFGVTFARAVRGGGAAARPGVRLRAGVPGPRSGVPGQPVAAALNARRRRRRPVPSAEPGLGRRAEVGHARRVTARAVALRASCSSRTASPTTSWSSSPSRRPAAAPGCSTSRTAPRRSPSWTPSAPAARPRPDLVVLDLNLPRVSGVDVLRRVKSDPVLRTIPVVVFSTSRADVDVVGRLRLRRQRVRREAGRPAPVHGRRPRHRGALDRCGPAALSTGGGRRPVLD